MPATRINGVRIFWEQRGESGPPLVLVHGSWGDHHNWDAVVPALARSFRVFTYDRRGHSDSERLEAQGSIQEDVADLAALIRTLNLAPAHVAGNSFGSAITLKLAASEPELLASMTVHEPPLLAMLGNDPMFAAVTQRIGAVVELLRAGRMEQGAELFVESVALGPGMWPQLPRDMQETFIRNAPTFLDEINEGPGVMAVDLPQLSGFLRPALLTRGEQSPPFFARILEAIATVLPEAQRHTFRGAGHVPHITHPGEYVEVLMDFMQSHLGIGARAQAGR